MSKIWMGGSLYFSMTGQLQQGSIERKKYTSLQHSLFVKTEPLTSLPCLLPSQTLAKKSVKVHCDLGSFLDNRRLFATLVRIVIIFRDLYVLLFAAC